MYTDLAKTAVSSTELYNLYGVVVDATSAHRNEKGGFKVIIKIIDQSMQGVSKDGKPQTDQSATPIFITMVANSPEQLPTFKRIGEIIRIHRCNISQYKNSKTFYANIAYGTSWVLFEGIPESKRRKMNECGEEDVEMSSGDLASDSEEEEMAAERLDQEKKVLKSEEAISNFFGFQNTNQLKHQGPQGK